MSQLLQTYRWEGHNHYSEITHPPSAFNIMFSQVNGFIDIIVSRSTFDSCTDSESCLPRHTGKATNRGRSLKTVSSIWKTTVKKPSRFKINVIICFHLIIISSINSVNTTIFVFVFLRFSPWFGCTKHVRNIRIGSSTSEITWVLVA